MIPLPEDIEAERALLATLCAAGAERAAWECTAILLKEDFVHPAHRAVFNALRALVDRQTDINSLTLKDSLEQAGDLSRVGGYTGLVELLSAEEVGRPMVLVNLLQRKRRFRSLVCLGMEISRQAQNQEELPEAIIERAGANLARLAMLRSRAGLRHVADLSGAALASLEDEMEGRQVNALWCKGWPRLNRMLGGFRPGQLIVLAARPGVGKTALAANWVLAGTEYLRAAGIFSLEMPAERVWCRLASAHAGIDLRTMTANRDREAFQRLQAARADLDQRGIWIEDRAGITAREILGEVDGLIARKPELALLVVDHLGLVSSPENQRSARQTEANRIGEITRALKVLAGDRRIAVLLLHQLNREVEHRQGNRPQLSDLRDSGCVEQDADVVMFIHRKVNLEVDPGQTEAETAELIIAKHREGPTGCIPMSWTGAFTRFAELERQTEAQGYQEPEEWV